MRVANLLYALVAEERQQHSTTLSSSSQSSAAPQPTINLQPAKNLATGMFSAAGSFFIGGPRRSFFGFLFKYFLLINRN
jgi:hypothetical protein